ncbi:MAG: glycoside hydrolase family 31 protein [Desulfotomaculaceae bacterium]|nr:glycoside hydrolase family 31 protein [Desulfotomaculaceae bacterium]
MSGAKEAPTTGRSKPPKMLAVRQGLLRGTLSFIQRWLNNEHPPGKGLRLTNNKVVYAGVDSLKLKGSNGVISFSPYGPGIFRAYYCAKDKAEPLLEDKSWTIDLAKQSADGWSLKRTAETSEYTCSLAGGIEAGITIVGTLGTIACRIDSTPVMLDLGPVQTTKEWLLVEKNLVRPGTVGVFGLGENTPPMNKAGKTVTMWNTSPIDYSTGANPLYQSWPVVIYQYAAGPAFGVVFDNPAYAVFRFSSDGKSLRYAIKDTELNCFFLLGPTLPELLGQLSYLTGTLPPLPKWSLGYQQSRWSYTPSAQVREITSEFRKRDIPCDVIYLDIDYMDHYKPFTWGKSFQDHQDLMRDLHSQGFKVVTILDPGLKVEPGYQPYESGVKQDMFVKDRNGANMNKLVWPGSVHFPDFINPSVREWWSTMVCEFLRSGVDGLWCDMNEPATFDFRSTLPPDAVHRRLQGSSTLTHRQVHNLYGFSMSRATYEGFLKTNRLPYLLTRSTYLGGQKFATTWTGDNSSNWEHLQASIPMMLNLGLSGQPISGPDIGGYRGSPGPALYQRWILQGALYPFSRTHTMEDSPDQEPWSFGPEVEASARRAIKLRYRLIPYFYSLLFEATRRGQPLLRPLFYYNPTAESLQPEYYETQFLLGPHLLAAPLMNLNPTRTCYLPPDQWYSWWTGKAVGGGQTYQTTAQKDTDLPLFLHENSVVPVYPEPPSYIPERSLDELELIITIRDIAQGLVVEYFNRSALLAYQAQFHLKESWVEGMIYMLRQGDVPEDYHPPVHLYLTINHRVEQMVLLTTCAGYSTEKHPNFDGWTKINIKRPGFPLSCRIKVNWSN